MENEFSTVDDVFKELESILIGNHNSRSGLSYQRSGKFKAARAENELEKIIYLIDSHVPNLRERTSMRFERILVKEECRESKNDLKMLKDIISTRCPTELDDCINEMKKQISEMPKEWTIIQLTSEFRALEHQNIDPETYPTNGLHVSVFNCGQSEANPFLVTLDPPSLDGNKLELLQELMKTLDYYSARLFKTGKKKFFKNHNEKSEYMLRTEDIELMLKSIVKRIEENWLREWRCLLIGKYQDNSVEENIRLELDNIFKNQLNGMAISQRSKELLYHIVKGAAHLRQVEILKAVQYCLSDINDQIIIKEVSRLMKEINVRINNEHEKLLRHPIILVIDESLDSLPWEMMEVLNAEPVSRVPSLHFAYFLFKAHEKEIEDGHKVIKNYENGKYVLNPDRDLNDMEIRMMHFYKYWLQDWNGINDRKPTSDEFYNLLQKADIFSYSGHGNGTHIMPIENLQKMHVKAVVLLFGCASTKIARLGPQVEMFGSYYMYLIARCPCVLGMLWPVTDVYTDIFTTEFLSNWIPSVAPIPWPNVDKSLWKKSGKCGVFTAANTNEGEIRNNLELLRAVSESKMKTEHYFTKAACVVRGLPVKIKLK